MCLVVLFHELHSCTKVVEIILLVRGGGITEPFDEVLHHGPSMAFVNAAGNQPFNFVGWGVVVLCRNRP